MTGTSLLTAQATPKAHSPPLSSCGQGPERPSPAEDKAQVPPQLAHGWARSLLRVTRSILRPRLST